VLFGGTQKLTHLELKFFYFFLFYGSENITNYSNPYHQVPELDTHLPECIPAGATLIPKN
jgi:hypothetical protein